MHIKKHYYDCDGCGTSSEMQETAADAKKWIEQKGWSLVPRYRDQSLSIVKAQQLCPKCQ